MTQDNLIENHRNVGHLIDDGRLREAFVALKTSPIVKKSPFLADILARQEQSYGFMLHYLAQGVNDNSRSKMLNEIKASLRFVNDALTRQATSADSPELYYSVLRLANLRNTSVKDSLDHVKTAGLMALLAQEAGDAKEQNRQFDDSLEQLFNSVWTMFGQSRDSYTMLADALDSDQTSFPVKAQILSALLIGNLKFFDAMAFSLLLDYFDSEPEPRLAARTLTAIVLILNRHHKRISQDSALVQRLAVWNDNISVYRQLRDAMMQIIRAHDTQRISDKMRNEVMPELMRLQPELLKKLKSISESADLEMLEANPEWEDLMNKNGLGDKLKELTDMQMEGGDVMMMAFSNLKGFPFFSKVSNWFLPFSSNHHEVAASGFDDSDSMTGLLDMEGVMCDSDKYSFVFSLTRMPEEQRKMMVAKMKEQMGQLREAIEEKKLKSSRPEFDSELTRYVRDLYRFFKLFTKKNEFDDPFSEPIDFLKLPVLGDLMSDQEILTLVGEFYFKRGYYKEALPMLEKLDSEENSDALLWEKIGYCHGATGNPQKSLEWYRKAELIHPESNWLIRKLAMTYHLTGNSIRSAQYFKKALEMDPENESLLLNTANVLLEAGETKEALSHFYHLDYLNPDSPSIWRSIAFTELKTGNTEKAIAYFERLRQRADSLPQDWIGSGNALFIAGRIPEAIDACRHALEMNGNEERLGAERKLLESSELLISLGADIETWKLILDKLRYSDL